MNQWVLSKVQTEETHYLFFDRGQDVVGGVVSLHVAASWTVADGQQKPLLRHWALLRSWHSSCAKHTRTHTQTHMIWSPGAFFWEKKKRHTLEHTYQTVCMYVQTNTTFVWVNHSLKHTGEWWGVTIDGHAPQPPPAKHKTHTHTRHMARRGKGCQCFTSVTVQINAIWPWDNTQVK